MLTISDSAPGSPQSVALSGTGEDFSVAAAAGSSTSATVSAGGTATYNLSISPQGGLTGAVSFTCTGAPSQATCTVNPGSVSLNGTSAAASTVSVATTAPTSAVRRPRPSTPALPKPGRPQGSPLLSLVLLALLTVAALYERRNSTPVPDCIGPSADGRYSRAVIRHPWDCRCRAAFVLAASLLFAIACLGCGGGGGVTHNPGTPKGTYTLTVTATLTSGSSTVTHTIPLTLTVD